MNEIKQQLDRMELMLEKVATNSLNNTEKIEILGQEVKELGQEVKKINQEVKNLNQEVKEFGRSQRNTKLELLDKLAGKDRVDNHEIRIQKLEKTII